MKTETKREGLSADCTLDKMVVMAIMTEGREHPCDRCNMDRKICRGYPRENQLTQAFNPVASAISDFTPSAIFTFQIVPSLQ